MEWSWKMFQPSCIWDPRCLGMARHHRRLSCVNVLPVLLYACEAWSPSKADLQRCLAFENNCLRRILGVSWRDNVTNQTIRQPPITARIAGQPFFLPGRVLKTLPDLALKTSQVNLRMDKGEERVVSVIIGIAVNGKAVGGVLHAPFYKPVPRTVWALGPLTNAVIAERCPPGRGMTVVLSEGETKATLLCTRKIDADFIMASGAGHKVLMVLDGLADAYLSPHPWTSKWDVCASDAILRAIGGVMTDAVGRPILYHKLVEPRNLTGMLASRTPEIHKRILKQVPFAVREELIWNERAP
ncbi:unnamed protein product [Cyprideis torosa]|uniref:3'(2'),5'-bisphosphate nucleotidase 1 n=1 Tax=Cyprideis torosa TaxID=163714 RepID=A0A7R8W9H4_9CRUS|nr:unnamed protein product [Cyprideis torosa]CAG0889838.1 unnamed protein product [Cyprideis torosa]